MSEFFQLLDVSSGNVINEFDTEQEALAALGAVGHEHGLAELANLALLRFEDGHPRLVAMEDELIARVRLEIERAVSVRGTAPHHAAD